MAAFLCSLVLITLHVAAAHNNYLALVQELMLMQSQPTCVGAGHSGGCCTGWSCGVSMGGRKCYCDRSCYNMMDCCMDIRKIGCLPSTPTTQSPTASQPTTPPPTTPTTQPPTASQPTTPPPTTPTTPTLPPTTPTTPTLPPTTPTLPPTTPTLPPTTPTLPPTTPTLPPTNLPPTTPSSPATNPSTTAPPSHCTRLQLRKPFGCCDGGASKCMVSTADKLCYCNENCYAEGNCCDDITAIGCYPKNCTQVNRTCCDPTMDANNCRITTGPNTGCYCNSGCSGKDCCPDHSNCNMTVLQEPQLQLSQSMRMRLLARLMADIPSQEWNDFRTANLRRRFRAGVIAQMQQYYDRERPWPGSYYGRK